MLAGYGTSARISRSAVDRLRSEGVRAGMFRPMTLSPFPEKELNVAASGKRVLVVEMSNGQFRDDVLLHLSRDKCTEVRLVNRMGGNLITVDDMLEASHRSLEAVL